MNIETEVRVNTIEDLQALYGEVSSPSVIKVVDHIHAVYRPFIAASPFAVLATSGPNGLDATPRGDAAGFVHVEDAKTILLPDRRGNNRIDSLRNIIVDPRVALLFLVPGIGETLRVNGTAEILSGPAYLARFSVAGQMPRSVLRITVSSVFFQCSRAVIRSSIWNPATHIDRQNLPSAGTILSILSKSEFDGEGYDQALPQRLTETLY
ncbi:pyridoxamine 5'-phosphate oxidase family protein [Allosphingosinicella deserti]|uniref:Flavin-nucleotide-binding protein n=1 Tax=Allosphingosinicella deserti TaxID=2116704 RepID=A0A2P7QZD7_9SPHN|nr:pyridoxamine 5'-phosphate oxidase family protein [Sphingomonas deserti]PSJ43321.1 flavin-nucleotide-binding protein [Sphingomonas deserti]